MTWGVTWVGMRTVVRTEAAAGAAISDASSAAAITAMTSDRERVAGGTFESLRDALWAPLAEPSKTRASSLPDAARAGADDGWMAARQGWGQSTELRHRGLGGAVGERP